MSDTARSVCVSSNQAARRMRRKNVMFFRPGPPGEPLEDEGAISRGLQGARHCDMELMTCWLNDSEDLTNKLSTSMPAIAQLGCHACKTSGLASNAEYDALVFHSSAGTPFVASFQSVATSFG